MLNPPAMAVLQPIFEDQPQNQAFHKLFISLQPRRLYVGSKLRTPVAHKVEKGAEGSPTVLRKRALKNIDFRLYGRFLIF